MRATIGVIRVGGKFYKGGQFYPGPKLNYGRQVFNLPDPGFINPLRLWPSRLMNGPAWLRYTTAGGGSALLIYGRT